MFKVIPLLLRSCPQLRSLSFMGCGRPKDPETKANILTAVTQHKHLASIEFLDANCKTQCLLPCSIVFLEMTCVVYLYPTNKFRLDLENATRANAATLEKEKRAKKQARYEYLENVKKL